MWPLPLPNNQHFSSYWPQQYNGHAIIPRTMNHTSRPRDRPRIFKGRIYTAPNHAMGSGDLRRNLPQLDTDGFNKLLFNAGDIVLQRYPTNAPPRWRNIPQAVAEEMKAAFLSLPRCSEVMGCSGTPDWTKEVLVLVLARAVNNRRALEMRKTRSGGSGAPRIAFLGAEREG